MDLADPTRSVTPSLDGPVLAVLSRASRPLTVGEVAKEAVRGSEIGVRRCLARLVAQGIVDAVPMGRNVVHTLNRDHVAAPVADLLAGLRAELARRLRETLGSWQPRPLRASLLTSAAGAAGEIAVLLVHQPLPGDTARHLATDMTAAARCAPPAPPEMTAEEEQVWCTQVAALHLLVRSWTGNDLRVVAMSSDDEADRLRRGSRLLEQVVRHSETLL
ncbi:MAG: hypothetical protein ACYCXY_08525 [Acidimicrobiales bacterium]